MTREEMQVLLKQAANPDTAAEALTAMSDGVTELFDTVDSLTTQAENDKATITGLRETNMKLFLRVTGANESHDEPETLEEYNKALQEKLLK